MFDLNRFIDAQNDDYLKAKGELLKGRKESHWIWYIFPQIKGLGFSYYSEFYGLDGIKEAKAYYENEILRSRLIELCNILLNLKEKDIRNIMGYPDDLKLKSSMTIFYIASKDEVFKKVLDKYYDSKLDENTVELLNR